MENVLPIIIENTILLLKCQGKIRRVNSWGAFNLKLRVVGASLVDAQKRAGTRPAPTFVPAGLSVKERAKGDPVPTFLQFFYNNEVGTEAPEARAGSLAPFFRARSRSGPKIHTDNSVCKPKLQKQFLPKQGLGRKREKISGGIYPENLISNWPSLNKHRH